MSESEIRAGILRLQQAIASGSILQSTTIGGQTFTFRTMLDMRQGIDALRRELALLLGANRSRLVATSKGA